MTTPATARLRVLVVASWFPAVDDPVRGRFIADQVQAVADAGRVDQEVLSFETIRLTGSQPYRTRQIAAIGETVGAAIGRNDGIFTGVAMHGPRAVPVARVPVAGGWQGIVGDHPVRQRALVLRALERSRGPWDVVHAHTGVPDAAGAVDMAARTGAALVITEHASFLATLFDDPPRKAAYLRAVAAAARVIAVSRTLAAELTASVPGLADKLVVIPNAVETDAFRPAPLASRRPEELLFVGYRLETKGIDVLLTAFRAVRDARPGATLRLIGRSIDAETEARWHRMAAELGIADAVGFDPPALREEVAEAMARASLLVHASPRETFGMTAVEALASGLPVVAVDSGGVTETLDGDPALGELVTPADPPAFAAAVLRALDRRASFDPAYLRASAVRRFSAEAVAGRLADLYGELRAAPDRPSTAPAPAASRLPAPGPGAPALRTILVVGFTTHRTVRLLTTLPRDLLGRIHLLCGEDETVAALPDGLANRTVVDLEGRYRVPPAPRAAAGRGAAARIRRVLRDPVGFVMRRLLRARAERHRTESARAALEAAIGALGPDRLATTDVVGVDGLDFLAVSLVPAAAARLAPGSLRWLADRHHAGLG